MGRIRTIKPEMLEDERVATLSSHAFRLFIACILSADDYGNFTAGVVPAKAFWGLMARGDVTAADTCAAMDELLAKSDDGAPGLLSLYRSHGQTFAHLTGWDRHQKIDHPGQPKAPAHDSADSVEITNDFASVQNPRETLANPREILGLEGKGRDRIGREKKNVGSSPSAARATEDTRTASGATAPGSSTIAESPLPREPAENPPASDKPTTEPLAPHQSHPGYLFALAPTTPTRGPCPAEAVFERYVSGWRTRIGGKRPPVFNPTRRKLVQQRLKDGLAPEDLFGAAEGVWRSEWHVENNHYGFELVFRSVATVEQFRDMPERNRPSTEVSWAGRGKVATADQSPVNGPAGALLGKWSATYASSKRGYGIYLPSPDDPAIVERLAMRAADAAGQPGVSHSAEDILAHWFRSYLRNDGAKGFYVEKRHALVWLERNLNDFGLPAEKKPRRPLVAEEPAEPTEEALRERDAFLSKAATFGNGGNGARVERPRHNDNGKA